MSTSTWSGFSLLLSLLIFSVPTACLSADLDRDGIDDLTEEALAKDFLPMIWYRGSETCPEPGVILYHVRPFVPGGSADTISVTYYAAYYEDCGINGHDFDSESFAITLYPLDDGPLGYGVHAIKTWAHRSSLMCEETEERIYDPPRPNVPATGDTLYGSWEDIFVSSGKHGFFLDENACNGHCFGADACDHDLLMNAGTLVAPDRGQFFYLYNIGEINDPLLENFSEIDDLGGFSFGSRSIWGSAFNVDIFYSTAPGPLLPVDIEIYSTYDNPLAVCEEQSVSFRLSYRSLVRSAVYDIAGNLVSAQYMGEFCPADTIRAISWDGLDSDGNCSPPDIYYLVLEAYRGGDGASDTDDFGISFLPDTQPAAPTDLSASVQGDGVILTWTDHSSIEDGFIVERRAGNCAFSRHDRLDGRPGTGEVSYTDSDVEREINYRYRVFAYRTFVGYSAFSNEAGATVPECLTDPNRILVGPTLDTDSVFSAHAYPVSIEVNDPACPLVEYEWTVYGNNYTEPGTIVGNGTDVTYFAPDLDCDGLDFPSYQNKIEVTTTYGTTSDSASTGWFTIFCNPPDSSGCPFLHVWDGEKFTAENNLLPLSEIRRGSVTDSYRLETRPVPVDARYLLEIREDEDERSFLDAIGLLQVDHSAEVKIGVTTNGTIFGYSGEAPPDRAINSAGDDVTGLLALDDGTVYRGERGEKVEVDFSRPGVEILVVTIQPGPVKKSLGPIVIPNRVGGDPGDGMAVGMGLPRHLEVPQYIEISPSPESDDHGSAFILSWQGRYGLDLVGSITGRSDSFRVKRLAPAEAIHTTEGDVRTKILAEDGIFTRLEHGERIRLGFPANEPSGKLERDFVLVVHGYYRH